MTCWSADGLLVDDRGVRPGDIGIRGGRSRRSRPPASWTDADRTLSAEGQLVLPGGIDAHVHFDFRLGQPDLPAVRRGQPGRHCTAGPPRSSTSPSAAPEGGSLLRGGRRQAPAGADGEISLRLRAAPDRHRRGRRRRARRGARRWSRTGCTTVKLFMNFPDFYPGDGAAAELFAELGRTGGTAVVHAENADVITVPDPAPDRGRAVGLALHRGQPSRLGGVRGGVARDRLRGQRRLSAVRAPRHVRRRGAGDRRGARPEASRCSPRCCHNYVVFSKEDVVERPDGANWGNYPPLRPPANRDALWDALADGLSATSQATTTPARWRSATSTGSTCPTVPSGHNGLETRHRRCSTPRPLLAAGGRCPASPSSPAAGSRADWGCGRQGEPAPRSRRRPRAV